GRAANPDVDAARGPRRDRRACAGDHSRPPDRARRRHVHAGRPGAGAVAEDRAVADAEAEAGSVPGADSSTEACARPGSGPGAEARAGPGTKARAGPRTAAGRHRASTVAAAAALDSNAASDAADAHTVAAA